MNSLVNRKAKECTDIPLALSLFTHPLMNQVNYCAWMQCIVYKSARYAKGIKLKGITRLLKQHMWPDYVYERPNYRISTGVSSSLEGKERGKLVHSELERYTNSPGVYISQKHNYIRSVESLHDYTKKAIFALDKWHLTPLCAEVAIGDIENMWGTMIDSVCLFTRGDERKLVLIEWKTGMDGYIEKGNKMMRGPLGRHFSNCPLNQAHAQLLMAKQMLIRYYGIIVSDAYVVNINTESVRPYRYPSIMGEMECEVYEYMISCLTAENLAKSERALNRKRVTKVVNPVSKKKKKI